jgi:hypothetical protein
MRPSTHYFGGDLLLAHELARRLFRLDGPGRPPQRPEGVMNMVSVRLRES